MRFIHNLLGVFLLVLTAVGSTMSAAPRALEQARRLAIIVCMFVFLET